MLVFGVTGGVGSGKSTVLQYIFENYNADIILTDILAKSMMSEDEELISKLKFEFNNDGIFSESGEILKEKLSALIFGNKDKLNKLNSIVHPMVKQRVNEIVKEKQKENSLDLFLVEAALLLEDNYDILFDCIYIYASKEVRTKRLFETRGYSKEKSQSIMANQMPDEVFFERCKYVIDNSSDFEKTINKIDELLMGEFRLEKKHGQEKS